MNCSNCKIAKKDVPCIPKGNDFKIAIALKEIIKADGETSERDIDIAQITSVNVIKPNGDAVDNTQNVYSFDLLEGTSTIILDFSNQEGANALPKGKYGIEVKGKRDDADSSDFCFSLPPGLAFEIVADSSHGYFPSDSIITYTVNGVVGVAQNVSSGGGGSATVGTLNTDNSTTQTPSASESFGGTINLHKVSKTGSYNDLLNKPTIPDAQIQADWNQTTSTAKDFIKNKPTIPSVSGLASQEWVNNQNFLKQHQDISGKEDKLTIETALAANSTAEFGKYYRLAISTATTINLPAITGNETTLTGFLIYLTINTGGSIDWNANNNETIMASGLSSIAEGKTYEVNAAWNGAVWAITANEFTAYSTT